MGNIISIEAHLAYDIDVTLTELRKKHQEWVDLKQLTEEKLYLLLEGCLELYYFLMESDAYVTAFKTLCDFKWGKKTPLAVLIAKAVFGHKAKQVHTYAKALNVAFEAKIGKPGNDTMLVWLRSNGGISGVTRSAPVIANKEAFTTQSLQRDYIKEIGMKAGSYGFRLKLPEIENAELAKFIESYPHSILLCTGSSYTNKVTFHSFNADEDLIDELFVRLGKQVMGTKEYVRAQREIYQAWQAEKVTAASDVKFKMREVVGGALAKIAVEEPEEAEEAFG